MQIKNDSCSRGCNRIETANSFLFFQGLPFKALATPSSSILVSPSMSGTIPITNLTMAAPSALPASVLANQAAHLKHTSFLGPNGGVFQTREIVYLGTGARGYATAYQPHHVAASPAQIQIPQQAIHMQHQSELAHLLQSSAIGLDQRTLGLDWTTVGVNRIASW